MNEPARRTIIPWVALAAFIIAIVALGTTMPAQADALGKPEITAIQTYQKGSTRTVSTWVADRVKRVWYREETVISSCSAPHFIISWTAVEGATGYISQYRETGTEGKWLGLMAQKKRGDGMIAATPPMKVNVDYDVRIAAVRDAETGEYTTTTARVQPDVSAPTGLTVNASDDYADTAILSWTNAEGSSPTHFAFQQRVTGGEWSRSSIRQVAEGATSMPVFNLASDVEHQFRLAPQSAFCTYNNWSDTASITLVRKPPTPTAAVVAGHQGNLPVITVTAQANARTDSYKLRYRQTGTESYTESALTTAAATAGHVITGLSGSTEYEVGLAAVNQYGDSAYDTSTVTTGEAIVLPVEPAFSLTAGHRNEATVITATVSQHADQNESYMLKYRRTGETDWSTPIAVAKTAAGTGHVIDVDADTSYDVAMAGVNGSRTSDYATETITSELEWFVPDAPTFTAAAKHKGNQAVIVVQVPNSQTGVTAYTLEVTKQVDGASAATQSLTPAQATAGYDYAVEHSATYSVRMSATGRNGDSPFSAATTVTAPPPLPKQPVFTATAGHRDMATVITVTVTSKDANAVDYVVETQVSNDEDAASTRHIASRNVAVVIPVEANTGYTVSVTGRNSGGEGPEATATIQSLTPFPAKPEATVTAGYDSQKRNIITVTVTSPDAHTTGYTITHEETGDEGAATTATVTKTAATAGHVILVEPETGYTITVTGNNSHGAGKSAEYTVTSLVEVKIPDQPVIAVAPAYDASNNSVLRVKVSNHDEDTTQYSYTLSRTGADDVTGTAQSDTDAATFSFDILAASPGDYSVSVKAHIATEASGAATATATAWASYVADVVLSKTTMTLSSGKTYEFYTVSLSQAPAAQGKVTLDITPGNSGAVHVLSQHIEEFNSGNWKAGQVLYAVLPNAPESADNVDFVHRLLLDGKATGNTATLSVTVSHP